MEFNLNGRQIQQHATKLGMQGDNKVETVKFVLPRFYNGQDLFEGIPFLLFQLPSRETGYVSLDKELEPTHYNNLREPENKEIETFTLIWEVGNQVTKEPGALNIELKISGLEDVLWHSELSMFQVYRSIQVESPQPVAFSSGKSRIAPRIATPDSEPPITIVERKIIVPPVLQTIAVQNDENSEVVKIKLPRYFDGNDLSTKPIFLHTVSEGGADDIPFLDPIITPTEIELHWTLKPPQTSFSGKLSLQLYVEGMVNGSKRYRWATSGETSVIILPFLGGEPIIPTTPSIMDEFIRQIAIIAEKAKASAESAKNSADRAEAEADRAADIAVKVPYIGDDGHWYVWNFETNSYVKTDSVANGNVMFATFEVNPRTGILEMQTPEGYKGALFQLSGNYLEVLV